MSVVILGSNHTNTAEYYINIGLEASTLIESADHEYSVGHTSVQDIPDLTLLEKVLSNAAQVYWAHSAVNEFDNAESYYNFLNWLKDYNLKHNNVVNLSTIKFDPYGWIPSFRLQENHAVFLGCSFTAGTGLIDPNTRYASLVSAYFNKLLLNLAVPGGNNNLIFDRFLQLDFHPGQIVVVQLTIPGRIQYCTKDKNLQPLILSTSTIEPTLHKSLLQVYHKDFLFYELLVKIKAMITIAEKKHIRLVFWLIDYKNEEVYSKLDQTYFYDMKQFVPANWIEDYLVDTASDNLHPGIESNKILARSLIKYIETIYKDQS